jgi:preprotein translocase subunit SecE
MSIVGKIKSYSSDVVKEMKKVSWPTKNQLKESTTIVIVTTVIITIFVYFVDWITGNIVKFIY